MKKRILSMILSIVMVFTLLPTFSLTAFATASAVSYLAPVYENGEIKLDANNDVVFETKTVTDYIVVEDIAYGGTITSADQMPTIGTSGETTWYVADSDVEWENFVLVQGDVHLIVCDDVTITSLYGIVVSDGNSLTIYGQENGTGKLIANGMKYSGGFYSAAIGGCDVTTEMANGGTITINGCKITATASSNAAAIGGGNGGHGGNIIINGGTVSATATAYSAAIGGGSRGNSGYITINGGIVSAETSGSSSAIGAGYVMYSSTGGSILAKTDKIEINGGTVVATQTDSYEEYPVIGGLYGFDNINISGGHITVSHARSGGIGIGTNSVTAMEFDGNLNISGGTIISGNDKTLYLGAGKTSSSAKGTVDVVVTGGNISGNVQKFSTLTDGTNNVVKKEFALVGAENKTPVTEIEGYEEYGLTDVVTDYDKLTIYVAENGEPESIKTDEKTYLEAADGVYGVEGEKILSFNANGGTGAMSSISFSGSESKTLSLNEFTRSYYNFTGWNTSPDGNGTSYADGASINITENTVLYAQWEQITYTVTFDSGDGTGTMENDTAYAAASNNYILPECTFAAPEGKLFRGWNVGTSSTILIPGTKITVSSDTTATAVWGEPVVEVTVDGVTTKYPSLEQVIPVVKDKDAEIKVINDFSLTAPTSIYANKLVLDLNNHTLDGSFYTFYLYCDVEVKGPGNIQFPRRPFYVCNNFKMTIGESVNITRTSGPNATSYAVQAFDGSTLILNGGSVTCSSTIAPAIYSTGTAVVVNADGVASTFSALNVYYNVTPTTAPTNVNTSGKIWYRIDNQITNGNVTIADGITTVYDEKIYGLAGQTVTITPEAGYTLADVKVNGNDATESSGNYTFTMPAGVATLTGTANSSHTHNWSYTATGDTITAGCDTAVCPIVSETLTISAPQHNKYGDGKDANATLSATKIGDITVSAAEIVYTKGNETLMAAPTDAGTYKAGITVDTDKIAFVEYTIAKAEAEIPTGLTAVYGQTLANVSLPTGWTWVNSASSVGNVGNQTHKAYYAGDDNHNAANDVELTIAVTQSGATMTATADKNSYTYGEDITVTVNIAPTAAAPVLFMVPPAADQIAIYNGSTQLTEPQTVGSQPMTFTVTGLDVGTYTLTAKYIAGNMEGKTANTQEITITKATPTITTLPTAGSITYGQTLNDSTLIGGEASVDGTFAWTDANTVPTVSGGNTGYEVIFTPNDTTNYTTATVTVALTVAPKDITGALVGAFETMTYNGGAQTPSAVVTIDGLTAEGRWSQVTNVTDTTTFTASGNFTGTIENLNPGMQKLPLTGATITLESDSLIYNGSAQSVTITSVKVGDVVVPAEAYSVSGNSGTEVNNYTLTVTAKENTNFTGSATKGFTIARSGSVIGNENIMVYRGETETTVFTYGDVITVKAQVEPTGSAPVTFALTAPSANQMALFHGDTQISEAVDAVDGVYTMTYSTTDKVVPVGTGITLTAKYVGNTNMGDTEKNVTVSLAAKPLTVDFAAATSREYAASNISVVITGVTISGKVLDTDVVSVDTTSLTGSLASDNAGTYTKVTLPALTLTGDHKDYYIISGGEVDTNVAIAQITGTTSVNASPVTYSDISAKTQDLADVVASFKNGTEALTYTVASKSSEIASASMDGSQLTFNLASGLTDAGTAAITVDVTGFTNYSKVTVTVNIELTDKTTVTVDMSDIVLVNRDFNGEALTYTGEAKADGYIGAFTYTWQDAEGNALTEAPSNAGTYRLAAAVSDAVFYAGSNYVTVTIAPKEVTVTALDKSAYVGSTAPDLSAPVAGKDYTISGLVDDTVVTVILSCTPDMSKAGEYAITSSASEESGNYTFTYVNGKLTVTYIPYIPSTPSAPTTQKVTVPISSDEETIHVDTKVKGDTATIDHVNLNHLDTVIGDHIEEIGTVTIDFSVLDKPITTVEIPTNAVKEIADAVNDPHNDAHSFEVILTDGTSIDFDAEAMAEMAVQADGNDITISIVSHEDAKLTSAQEYIVGDHVAFDINVTSGGEHISDMGGKVSVHVPYELKQGERAGGIVVYYVDDFGNRERCETSYDSIKKRVNFKTDHLSLYMIDYDAALAESCDGVTNCPSKAFNDLDTSLWYHEATDYALENGLMNGVGNNLFDPNGTTSRAMIVTILWRLEGEPVVNYLMQFEDVVAETWYTEAVRWAASEGIVEGYSNTSFGPNDPITREQLATILYRYEQYKGGGFTGAWMFLLDYIDRDKVSDWAYEAMCWTTMHGVINGRGDGILDPKGSAKRCEAAQMLMNYLDK